MRTIKMLVVLMAIAVTSSAQVKVFIGAKGQFGITQLPNSQYSLPVSYKGLSTNVNLKLSFGSSYGIFGGVQILKLLKIQGEVLLTQVKQDYKDIKPLNSNSTTEDLYAITEVKALDLPIMAQLGLGVIYLEAGPVFNVILKSSFKSNLDSLKKDDGSWETIKGAKEIDLKSRYEKVNIGLAVGTGSNISIGPVGLHVGLRYYMGLNKFGKNVDELKQNLKTERTGVWSLMANLGVRFIF